MYPSNEQGLKDVNSSGVRGYIRSGKPIVNKLIIMSLQDQASMPRLVDGGQESKAASRSLLHVQACYYCIPTPSKPTRLTVIQTPLLLLLLPKVERHAKRTTYYVLRF